MNKLHMLNFGSLINQISDAVDMSAEDREKFEKDLYEAYVSLGIHIRELDKYFSKKFPNE